MEECEQVADKNYDEDCVRFMLAEHSKMSDQTEPVFYIRSTSYLPFIWSQIEKQLQRLEELGLVNVTGYVRRFTGEVVPESRTVNILPPGMELIRAKVTEHTVTTTTIDKVTEILPEPSTYVEREKKRQFMRTERGFTIMNETNLADLVNYHVNRRTEQGASIKDQKSARVWLDYIIRWRRSDLEQSPALLEKARYHRDLPIKRRR